MFGGRHWAQRPQDRGFITKCHLRSVWPRSMGSPSRSSRSGISLQCHAPAALDLCLQPSNRKLKPLPGQHPANHPHHRSCRLKYAEHSAARTANHIPPYICPHVPLCGRTSAIGASSKAVDLEWRYGSVIAEKGGLRGKEGFPPAAPGSAAGHTS